MTPMNRREAIKSSTALLGGVLVTSVALPACSPSESRRAADAPNAPTSALNAAYQTLIEDMFEEDGTPFLPGAQGFFNPFGWGVW